MNNKLDKLPTDNDSKEPLPLKPLAKLDPISSRNGKIPPIMNPISVPPPTTTNINLNILFLKKTFFFNLSPSTTNVNVSNGTSFNFNYTLNSKAYDFGNTNATAVTQISNQTFITNLTSMPTTVTTTMSTTPLYITSTTTKTGGKII